MNRLNGNPLLTKPTWLWLLLGFLLLPFTMWQNTIPLAAWVAPIFLLRFARTYKRPWLACLLVLIAYDVAIAISARGAGAGNTMIVNLIGAIPLMVKGLFYSSAYAADRQISPRLGKWGRTLVFPLAFTTVDWLMSRLSLVMNTGSPAYSQYGDLPLMQILSITGIWGLTFLIAWCASTANSLWEQRFDWRSERARLALFAGTLAAVFVYGALRLWLAAPYLGTVQAATITVDPSITQAASAAVDWATFNRSSDAQRAAARPQFEATVDLMLARTETALRGGARLVGWSEGSALVLEEDKPSLLDRVATLAKRYDAYIQVGLWVATRTSNRNYVLNQSILVDSNGQVAWEYDKAQPVFLSEWWVMIPGDGRMPLVSTPYGLMSTAICNDLHFQALIRQVGLNHVDILMAPYGDLYPFGQQDFAVSVYRAIENGVSIVRTASNGTSAVIDYQGRIIKSTDFFNNPGGIMLAPIPIRGAATLYSQIGDLFAYLCVVGLIFLAGWAFVRHERAAPLARPQPA